MQSFAAVKTAIEDAARFDVVILDGKPNASDQTYEIASASDLVVIPTGQTVDDLHPGVVLAHALRKKHRDRADRIRDVQDDWKRARE